MSSGSRWRRLWPSRDGRDAGGLLLVFLGVLLWLVARLSWAAQQDVAAAFGIGPVALLVGGLLQAHGATPTLAFLGAALYLTHRGRSLGRDKWWVWGGLVWVVPLMVLGAEELAVRGGFAGGAAVAVWNLVGAGLMGLGVWRTLR